MTVSARQQQHPLEAEGRAAVRSGRIAGLPELTPPLRVLLLLAAALAGWAAYTLTERRFGVLEPAQIIAIDDFPEISGIAYWPERGTLIGVGDNGEVAELTLQGKVLRKRILRQRDFEDVVIVPGQDMALVIEEQPNRLVSLRLSDFEIVGEENAPVGFVQARRGNKRFEGLASTQHGLALSNETPAAVSLLETATGRPLRTVLLGAKSVSSVMAGPQGELLLTSRENGLLMLDADGSTVGDGWRPVEYHHIEGAALVPGFGLVLCVDRNPGVLLVFSSIRDWPDLRHALASGG